jgi:hypothetical protein
MISSSIHFSTNDIISFFFMAEYTEYFTEYMNTLFMI